MAERKNPWYELVGSVRKGDTVYHYNGSEKRFVGRSIAADDAVHDPAERRYSVELRGFEPLAAAIDLAFLRGRSSQLYAMREALQAEHPDDTVYSPFQFRGSKLYGMMSNCFAKLPREVVRELFGSDGLAEGELPEVSVPSQPEDESDVDPGPSCGSFLKPFKKADTDYLTNVVGGRRRKNRRHESLINDCSAWLKDNGYEPMCNAAVDLGLEQPSVLIEGKTIASSWAAPIREAVSQLYEYRYFKVADPQSRSSFSPKREVPPGWINYLEADRDIGVMWPKGRGYHFSQLAGRAVRP